MQDQNLNRQLLQTLNGLILKQESLQQEIEALRRQVIALSDKPKEEAPLAPAAPAPLEAEAAPAWPSLPLMPEEPLNRAPKRPPLSLQEEHTAAALAQPKAPLPKSDLEKFIGENLINKIGILITVIGVAIGARYSIENELISPLTRIILGYAAGLGLMGFAIYLKKNYKNLSAVLLSGALAILYFITFSAYSFYELIPQGVAFGLMLVFTAFTVVAALHYNMQVIAHIGLVGAYAVPFLLSDGSGRVHILFSYMAIINAGILAIAYKRYWKPLYFAAFGLSWLIYLAWYGFDYRLENHFTIGLLFATIFFVLFYLTLLSYKLARRELFGRSDVVLLLLNSFIFFGAGYAILDGNPLTNGYLGLFTLLNALIHLGVCTLVYRKRLADRNLFYLLAGLVLVFITIAVPVQLDGKWVTLLWTGEALLLFWIGRSRTVKIYEQLSFPLMLLAFASLLHDWADYYPMGYYGGTDTNFRVLINSTFLTSLLFVASFAFINWYHHREPARSASKTLAVLFPWVLGGILMVTAFFTFKLELSGYWIQQYWASHIDIPETQTDPAIWLYNSTYIHLETVWVIIYAMLFFSLVGIINLHKLRNRLLGWLFLGLSGITLMAFLTQGLDALDQLRQAWMLPSNPDFYPQGVGNLLIRYVAMAFAALLLWLIYRQKTAPYLQTDVTLAFDALLWGSLLWVASNELLHWMSLAGWRETDKLALSILWGLFALLAIVAGIVQKKKHLRMGAFLLFGITLLKLFFYDIAHLNTISKTIVMVSLGVLLLIISFLYNKYKHLISDAKPE